MPEDLLAESLIDVQNVTRHYGRRRRITALDNVTVAIHRAHITAVVGPNGAGKSTLFAAILGFIRPSSGIISIAGDDPRHYVLDHGIGYAPDRFTLPSEWRVGQAMSALGRLNDLTPAAIDAAIDAFGLHEHRGKRIGALSRGLLQRVGLAQAFAAERELLVLDEPAEGLDPVWRIQLRDRITAQRNAGRTVLVASHDLAEVERIADHVIILERGAVKDVVDMRRMRTAASVQYRLTLESDVPAIANLFPDVVAHGDGVYSVAVPNAADLTSRVAAMIELGAIVVAVTPSNVLEDRVRTTVQS